MLVHRSRCSVSCSWPSHESYPESPEGHSEPSRVVFCTGTHLQAYHCLNRHPFPTKCHAACHTHVASCHGKSWFSMSCHACRIMTSNIIWHHMMCAVCGNPYNLKWSRRPCCRGSPGVFRLKAMEWDENLRQDGSGLVSFLECRR